MNKQQATMKYAHHMMGTWNTMFKMCAAKNGVKELDGKPLKSAKFYKKQNQNEHKAMNKMEIKGLNGEYHN